MGALNPASEFDLIDGLEWTACEICGQQARVPVVSRPDLLLGGSVVYSMYKCRGCGAIYQCPRPVPASASPHYPSDYLPYTPALHTDNWLSRLQRHYGLRKRCRVVTRYIHSGRLLDVGFATGDFISEMRQLSGWSVFGIELTHFAARYARAQVGLDVSEGLLSAAPFVSASFDAVTMWDVLGFMADPCAVIREVARLLRPGGILVVAHPNLDSIDRRLFGQFWCGYALPRLCYLFPLTLLRCLMAEQELYEVDRCCLYRSHAGHMTSLVWMLEACLGRNSFTHVVRHILLGLPFRVLMMPYFKLIDLRGLGSQMTLVFQKAG